LRDVDIKFRNIKKEYEESILKENFNNQKLSREQSSEFRSRSETSKSNMNNQNSNNREMSQAFAFDQVNAFICYNCDKSDHIARRCSALRKMNLNNFVRKIKKNIFEQNVESRKD
jgi:S-adenosylmethionine synthetase